ncbi:MAG: hypothetical protein OP8BY_0372 [Candidatus Saccharicenans subterraneus]|uniref:Uncharacterized protein n=1 Tax=Candidatus Saccharicenans subterraneus TaxID=2508984 RepID=A0A3E2BLE1_9BACT|nr:MAG: hypothetical protein OP8BY_0372 [Candidatus Saccharicenans subterraneum]
MKTDEKYLDLILKKSLSGMPRPELSPDFLASVVQKISQQQKSGPGSGWKTLVQMAFYWTAMLLCSLGLGYATKVNQTFLPAVLAISPLVFLGPALFRRILN